MVLSRGTHALRISSMRNLGQGKTAGILGDHFLISMKIYILRRFLESCWIYTYISTCKFLYQRLMLFGTHP